MNGILRGWRGVAAAALALALLPGCASGPSTTGLKVLARKGRPFVIVQTDRAKGWGVANHPILCRVSDRRLALSYWIAGDAVTEGTAPVGWPAYSDDDGRTWQFGDPYAWLGEPPPPEARVIEAGSRFAHYDFGYFMAAAVLPSGERVHHDRTAVLAPTGSLGSIRSADGVHWTSPERVPLDVPLEGGAAPANLYFEQQAVVSTGGVLYVAGYGQVPSEECYATFLFESRDGGRSYRYVSKVASMAQAPWGIEGADEPALVLLPDGELLCVMRTGAPWSGGGISVSRDLLSARSRDGGRSWEYRRLPIAGVMPKLRLLTNGILALATGRPGNSLFFSADGGRTWGREVVLSRADQKTSGYCDLVEVSPGRLLAIYDSMDTDLSGIWLWEPKEANGIFGVYIHVTRLF
ncbi:MAG TPA: sialidase family protein [Kiritimatiellia bacterium]|nr:sialidase family protein [Kiritimatiellia bacterium]HRZ11469.1 sialidase family protein [Kiritimatiellia bacterium]HSA16980.1 sialidase family protein [Kiritimatiellia bacterium]